MINTTLCYIENDNKYLMLHRNKKQNDLNAAKWIGVGGKFEPGETVEECLVREVFEETGLTLTKYIYVGMIKFVSDIYEDEDMYLFKGTEFTGEVKEDCREGTLKWVNSEEVLDLPTWEGDRYFLKPLLDGCTGLNMTVCYEGDKLVKIVDSTQQVEIDSSSLISSPHGFSTRIGGVSDGVYGSLNLGMNRGDEQARVTENWRRFMEKCGIGYRPFVCGKQVHGNNVHVATFEDARWAYGPGEIIEADGYVTKEKELPIAIFTADCVPVLLEDKEAGVIGVIHCGWRSTVADIEGKAIEKMLELGASTSNINVAIGPAIEQCCFEVGPEVVEAANALLRKGTSISVNSKGFKAKLDSSAEESEFAVPGAPDKYMLDLKAVVEQRMIQLGISSNNIEKVGMCTMCHPDRYYSHRYYSQGDSNQSRGSLATVIMMK